MTHLSRRQLIATTLSGMAVPSSLWAANPREIGWDDLIPKGVPYSEIIGEGEMDEVNDTWNPIYDANATKLNDKLNGAYVRMPGFIIPLELGSKGVTDFILVPYVGACLHTPPPPANQLVFVKADPPWPNQEFWAPIWVTGVIRTQLQSTEIAKTGYSLSADNIEFYEW
ncbi:DUF3299 domain-containing protein [Roseovarius sp. EL26]|uniref:DUF3299 domain-containing protein n=1 Tax=Roseovarius sp. EL26 TaxID=2126672 RepID=UPI000EA27327|nr:DUF3299 domain-containing protein [Roseovarius sp. EL26]